MSVFDVDSDSSATKKKMQKVANISIFVMYSMYFLAALFGYLTFYGENGLQLLALVFTAHTHTHDITPQLYTVVV